MNRQDEFVANMRRFHREVRQDQRWKWGLVAIALVILAAGLFSSMYTVATEGQAVVKRFGAVVAVKQPGLHFKLPFGIDTAYFVPTKRVLKEEFGFRTVQPGQRTRYTKTDKTSQESLMLTGDLNVLDVEWVVQYRIIDPDKYLHRVRNQTETIRDISEAVTRRIVGNRLGSDVLTVGRVDVAARAREEMERVLKDYELGVSIDTVELQDVTPPDPVKPAFNEVNEARQERERLINEAEKYRNQVIPRAKGEAAQTIAEAEAYRAERVNSAKGEAARFKSVLKEYSQAKDVTRQRLFLEMIDTVLPKVGRVVAMDRANQSVLPLLDLEGNVLNRESQSRNQEQER